MLVSKRVLAIVLGTGLVMTPAYAGPQTQKAQAGVKDKIESMVKPQDISERKTVNAPRIQIALLLDTSNSMDGLISQAKSQLWKLVNELAEGKKNGETPIIELALYEYGNSGIAVSKGYIRQVLPLSTDLDGVSEKLFALKTNGGQEYAGQVIKTALDELEWSKRADDMKLIIIAGNEPFTQGPVHYESACERARTKGVIIDTIHCGNEATGVATKWKAGADCGGGIYMVINQDEQVVDIPTPYDDEIVQLNKKLNQTYLGYGARGKEYKSRQETQDVNAASISKGTSIARLKSKVSKAYNNEAWDIVDAYKKDKDKVLALPESELPKEIKGLSQEKRASFIEHKSKERDELRAQIKALQDKRDAIVAAKRREMAATKTLDNVMVGAVRAQATRKGYNFSK